MLQNRPLITGLSGNHNHVVSRFGSYSDLVKVSWIYFGGALWELAFVIVLACALSRDGE